MLCGFSSMLYSPTTPAVFLLFYLSSCARVLNYSHPVNSFVGLRCTYSVVVVPFTNVQIIQYLLPPSILKSGPFSLFTWF